MRKTTHFSEEPHSGWQKGDVKEWDKARALFPGRLLDFIRQAQPQ